MFLVYCMFCFATIVFNTRVNVYSQGNRKCSFLPGFVPAFICIDLLISRISKINDDDDDDDDEYLIVVLRHWPLLFIA